MELLKIDGSHGEGGGQIIRTAVAISSLTGIPVEIENIRKNRKVPGLRAQHLTGIKILQKICNADAEGLAIGSTSIKFFPKEISEANLTENIGTAGSISLVLQALIPVVSIAKKTLNLSITGGTDVPWSPTFFYTKYVLGEAYKRVGINFSFDLIKRGYYPKGGGVVDLKVFPAEKLVPTKLSERKTRDVNLLCSYSMIDSKLISTKINQIKNALEKNQFNVRLGLLEENALDKGASVLAYCSDSTSIIGCDTLYSTKNQNFEKDIVNDFIRYKNGVDDHLSDMLVIPSGLTDDTSIFRVNKITKHLETNLYVVSKMTGCKYGVSKIENGYEVRVKGVSYSSIK